MAKRKLRTFDQVEEEYYRDHPDEIESYLKGSFEEYAKDGATSALLCSLRMVAPSYYFKKAFIVSENTVKLCAPVIGLISTNASPSNRPTKKLGVPVIPMLCP